MLFFSVVLPGHQEYHHRHHHYHKHRQSHLYHSLPAQSWGDWGSYPIAWIKYIFLLTPGLSTIRILADIIVMQKSKISKPVKCYFTEVSLF